jgi:hypothetical protein
MTTVEANATDVSACGCLPGFYQIDSITTVETRCLECPVGARCLGRTTLEIQSGFWRGEDTFDVYECRAGCLGGISSTCASGYEGAKCHRCADGYGRLGAQCAPCPPDQTNIIYLASLCAVVLFTVVAVVRSSVHSKLPFVRIVFTYVQSMALVSSIGFKWPDSVAKSLASFATLASFSMDMLPVDCALPGISYFDKFILILILPALGILLPIVFYLLEYVFVDLIMRRAVASWTPRGVGHHARKALATIVVCCLLLQPIVCSRVLNIFVCTPVDGTSVIDENPSTHCSTPEYKFIELIALIALSVYVVGMPLVLAFALVRYRGRLHEEKVAQVLGVLTKYFVPRHQASSAYLWEVVITFRKTAIVAAIVSLRATPLLQVMVASWVIFFALMLHLSIRPFVSRSAHYLETVCLVATYIILFMGQVFLRDSEPGMDAEGMVIAVLLLIVAATPIFALVTAFIIECTVNRRAKLNPGAETFDDGLERLSGLASVVPETFDYAERAEDSDAGGVINSAWNMLGMTGTTPVDSRKSSDSGSDDSEDNDTDKDESSAVGGISNEESES